MTSKLGALVLELAEAVDNAEQDIGGSRPQLDILRDAVKAAEAEEGDTALLDFIEETGSYPWPDFGNVWKFRVGKQTHSARSLREVLTAALKAEKKGGA